MRKKTKLNWINGRVRLLKEVFVLPKVKLSLLSHEDLSILPSTSLQSSWITSGCARVCVCVSVAVVTSVILLKSTLVSWAVVTSLAHGRWAKRGTRQEIETQGHSSHTVGVVERTVEDGVATTPQITATFTHTNHAFVEFRHCGWKDYGCVRFIYWPFTLIGCKSGFFHREWGFSCCYFFGRYLQTIWGPLGATTMTSPLR